VINDGRVLAPNPLERGDYAVFPFSTKAVKKEQTVLANRGSEGITRNPLEAFAKAISLATAEPEPH